MDLLVSPKLEPVELDPDHDGDGDLAMLDAENDVPRRGLLSNSLLTVTKEDEFDIIRYCFSMHAAAEHANHLLDQCRQAAHHVRVVKEHERAVKAGTVDETMARPIATPSHTRLAKAYTKISEIQQRADHRYQVAQTVYYATLRREWVPPPVMPF